MTIIIHFKKHSSRKESIIFHFIFTLVENNQSFMSTDNNWSFIMAERLRELRESHGLSHAKLSSALENQYGINISTDSLMNYEVSNEFHTKAHKNMGPIVGE